MSFTAIVFQCGPYCITFFFYFSQKFLLSFDKKCRLVKKKKENKIKNQKMFSFFVPEALSPFYYDDP